MTRINLRPEGEPLPAALWGLTGEQWASIYALARRYERDGVLTEYPGCRTIQDVQEMTAPPRLRFARWLADERRISG